MTTYTKAQRADQLEAREELRGILSRGDTVNVIQRSVSRSGMLRRLSLFAGDRNITHTAARAMGDKLDHSTGYAAIRVPGCGMDMHFHLVYSLASILFADDPDVDPHRAGYELKHRTL